MNFPLCFYEKHNFTILIDSLNQHYVTGRFKVNNLDLECDHHFNGLTYQLTNNIYNFTFAIDWHYADVPSHTTFSGILHLDNDKNQNILDLKWLLIMGKDKKITQGASYLHEEHQLSTPIKSGLPFPNIRSKVMIS